MSSDESSGLLGSQMGLRATGPSWVVRYSVGDWVFVAVVFLIGQWADKIPPFEHDVKPQLKDPTIAYAHVPLSQQQSLGVPGVPDSIVVAKNVLNADPVQLDERRPAATVEMLNSSQIGLKLGTVVDALLEFPLLDRCPEHRLLGTGGPL